jgi:hypothetical protein
MPKIEIGHGGSFEERQLVELTERIRNVVVESVDLPNPVHVQRPPWCPLKVLKTTRTAIRHGAGYLAVLATAGSSMRHRSP